MIFPELGDKKIKGAAPPEGDVAWLWYRPVGAGPSSLYPTNNAYCKKCDTWEVIEDGVPMKCWICGRFVSRPKSWSEYYYNPNGRVPETS